MGFEQFSSPKGGEIDQKIQMRTFAHNPLSLSVQTLTPT